MSRPLSSDLYIDESQCVEEMLALVRWEGDLALHTQRRAKRLIEKIRNAKRPSGQLESFLQNYALTTEEGMALMSLAEALLRIPDKQTVNLLIRDKVAAANWLSTTGGTKDWVVKAAGLGLMMTSRTLDGALSRVGEPVIREAMIKAMQMLGKQFVLGTDIEEAVQNAAKFRDKGYRMSYDILGEGSRTMADAERYFESYIKAIDYVGMRGSQDDQRRPGISVKLSALHPRYEYAQKDRCVPAMTNMVTQLARMAAQHKLAFTIDAEETERLDLSLEIARGVMQDNALEGWEGFGLAVQTYHKRAFPLLDELAVLAKQHKRRLQIRLVKGAYWDTEIKRAQVLGLSDYPVFTRKVNTDVSFIACMERLFRAKDRFYPMLGTHNAYSVAAALEMAKAYDAPFEFQRLYGMGEVLHDAVMQSEQTRASIYAPVGSHKDLLPYLVRRLLENGANTSFVNRLLNPDEPVDELVHDPVENARSHTERRHPKIPLPANLYMHENPDMRINSAGLDLSDPQSVEDLEKAMSRHKGPQDAMPLIGGKAYKDTAPEELHNSADGKDNLGMVWPGNKSLADKAMRVAGEAFTMWSQTSADERAQALERYADLLEENHAELMSLCVREAGKTIPDALAEIREAVDFCRYYAVRGRGDFSEAGETLSGPTGERNVLTLQGRGVFVCISPWNFPLAIFTGQVVAALMAGNAVVAKPAEQTPLIACRAVQLMHKAGIPESVINLVTGDGRIGAALVAHKDVAGVAFTGSTEVAREINRTLAAKNGPIVPLIAETGGQNAMIVDSSALPEQVIDDVLLSAFGSAGQRCSALRVLCLQDEVADKIIRMLRGAMAELKIGQPKHLSTDIGPVIDEEALASLIKHRKNLDGFAKLVYEVSMTPDLEDTGHFFAPCAFEIESIDNLRNEVFGPVLHIVRYSSEQRDELLEEINNTGFGLTFGIHSRIENLQNTLSRNILAGNVYVNRSMTGAVVGVQPFGGQGLSGTGPKAGGPHYLPRFATEKVVSTDTTAAGGNASLVLIEE